MIRPQFRFTALVAGILLAAVTSPVSAKPFTTFESGQVRPLALSPDGSHLFALNTPDNRLEIFAVGALGLTHQGSVPVGLEPVAVAARSNDEVWVVNHLSDSVSIVDVAAVPPRVVRTLLVGDEPRDIVFAGSGGDRAFITTAHRGQNRPGFDPQLTTPGIGRADVFVFDANDLGNTLEGTPLTVLTLFTDTPRALAVSADKGTVYAAGFHTGNQTTTVSEGVVCDTNQTRLNNNTVQPSCTILGTTYPGGMPLPHRSHDNVVRPETGLIVRYHAASGQWRDQLSRNWNNAVRFNLPDKDVFSIDANANPPIETSFFTGVGTVLFNMVVNPMSGKVYVSNTEARNEVRFEGPGGGGTTVRGHLHETRITVLDGMTVTPRHLNKHINYAVYPAPAGVKDNSLAIPTDMVVSSAGTTLYVAAFGSSKVGVFQTASLENDSFTPDSANHVLLTGGGPSGLVLDEINGKLYVLTRFDNSVSVVDVSSKTEVDHLSLHNPEPAVIVKGRRFLYDAYHTSSNGEASCASCHIFGDFDSLAWDLGNPDEEVLFNPNPIRVENLLAGFGFVSMKDFHPMKGPMTTQSLRGMANHGPMHWRGDRTGGNDPGPGSVINRALDEDAAFKKFNGAFPGLLGRTNQLTEEEMQQFTDFILQVVYPPNPIRSIDNSLTPDEEAGRAFFHGASSDVFQNCDGCHRHDPSAGFFGSDGFSSFEAEPQFMKIAHLRNMYQKVGMFGMPAINFFNAGDNSHKGDQVRGFGFLHDGSTDTVLRFLNATVFNQSQFNGALPNPGGFANGVAGDPARRQVEAFVMAMDSEMAPIVGQQITLDHTNAALVGARIDVLLTRAGVGECDVIVKGPVGGQMRGWAFDGSRFLSDRIAEPPLGDTALRAVATTPGQPLTYTCMPSGTGLRAGIDRDNDGVRDGDELVAGSDPAQPAFACASPNEIDRSKLKIGRNGDPYGDETLSLRGQAILPGSLDPISDGVRLRIENSEGLTVFVRNIPGGASVDRGPGWSSNSKGTTFTFKDRSGTNGGITKVVLRDRSSREPGLATISVTGKKSVFQVAREDAPLRVVFAVDATAEQCAEIDYRVVAPSTPRCTVSADASKVQCK